MDISLIYNNAVEELADRIDDLRNDLPSRNSALYVCRSFRRMAISHMLLSGISTGFVEHLSNSAYAYISYLNRGDRDLMATSVSYPFFDAVAAGCEEAALIISKLTPHKVNVRVEYEEEFYYVRTLMDLYSGNLDKIESYITEFETLLTEDDLRLDLLKTLTFEKDSKAFNKMLNNMTRIRKDRISKKVDDVLNKRVDIEFVAIIKIAKRFGLSAEPHYALAPSTAFEPNPDFIPKPDDWKMVV